MSVTTPTTADASRQTWDGPLLDVRDLRTYFKTEDGIVRAVDGVSFSVRAGETLGVVGESGCGKSVTMMSIMSLNAKPGKLDVAPGVDVRSSMVSYLQNSKKHLALSTGEALFRGENLLRAPGSRLRDIRGSEIAMIFQDPMTSLNPVRSVGNQLIEAVKLHRNVSSSEARDRAIAGLVEVGIPRAQRRIDDYPHQFSGGMRQRVMIAMALINDPDLLIADEPTTALDVTTQAQILELIRKLQEEHGTAVIMITHDLGVVAEVADEVVVMYAARVAERANVDELFERPRHPYTWGLLGSLPRLDVDVERLTQIAGQPPSLLNPPAGCRFSPRCDYSFDRCRRELPNVVASSSDPTHFDACFLSDEQKQAGAAEVLVAPGDGGAPA